MRVVYYGRRWSMIVEDGSVISPDGWRWWRCMVIIAAGGSG